jgi:hypothetical protein
LAKLEELEHLNDRLASASSLALEVASAEHQKERLESATDLLRERLRQGLEEERDLSERIGELRARALQLDELEAAVCAREEELQRHETRHTDLEERCRQLAAAATLHEGTVHVLSKDLILRIDAVEEEIARFRRFDTGMDAVHELEQVRQSLLDLLVSYGIRPFGFAAGERVGPEARERMEVVAAKSDSCRDTVKVIETVRPGYVHDGPRGQTILRPAGVVTSHLC